MLKKAGRYVFFLTIYLSGIVIGGVYTPQVITYAKQINAQKQHEPQQIKKKPQPKKPRFGRNKRIV